jgi:hypothetical protein
MKKFLIITLIDGREIKRDITTDEVRDQNNRIRIGVPANDIHYALLCQAVATGGFSDIDNVSDTSYVHVAPTQIKNVAVKFEKEVSPLKLN